MAPKSSPQPRRLESPPGEADEAASQVRGRSGDGVQVVEEVPRPAVDDEREDALRVEIDAGGGDVAAEGAHLHRRAKREPRASN